MQDDSMLLALSMLLDGSTPPAPPAGLGPMAAHAPLDLDFGPQHMHARSGNLPLSGPKASTLYHVQVCLAMHMFIACSNNTWLDFCTSVVLCSTSV